MAQQRRRPVRTPCATTDFARAGWRGTCFVPGMDPVMSAVNPSVAAPAGAGAAPPSAAPPALWGGDGFTFGDLVDIFNPLQHIPLVS